MVKLNSLKKILTGILVACELEFIYGKFVIALFVMRAYLERFVIGINNLVLLG